jgi:hypothetical protein
MINSDYDGFTVMIRDHAGGQGTPGHTALFKKGADRRFANPI